MDTSFSEGPEKLLSLQETAKQLGVSVDVLLKWNDYHILTPKITPSGQIGYTQQQINQFLTIQHTLQVGEKLPVSHFSQNMHHISPQPSSETFTKSSGIHSKLFLGLFAMSSISFFLLLFTTQGTLFSLLSGYEQTLQTTYVTKESSQTLTQPLSGIQTTQLKDSNTSTSLQAPSQNMKSALAENYPVRKVSPTPQTSIQQKQVLATVAAAFASSKQQKLTITPFPTPSGITDVSTYASTSQQHAPDNSSNSLDSNENIVGLGQKPNQLATILGAGSVGSAGSTPVTIDLRNQFILLIILALTSFVVILRKKQKYIPASAVVKPQVAMPSEKLIEIHQKMDGTVFLTLGGSEYKISKPELDSDSDKFIERLFQLMVPGQKEMEYESLTDTIRLTTPLSRIVTRLGFVGTKRDLFFPRTSKHRVLFRKYITRDDLLAMNLSISQIQQELLLGF